jgi:hypothetical protein
MFAFCRKIRADDFWLEATLRPYRGVEDAKTARENEELTKRSEDAPMPTTVSAFKVGTVGS